MLFRLPPRSFYGGRIIDASNRPEAGGVRPEEMLPSGSSQQCDPATVRFRSIAEILLRGIRRCVATDRELNGDSEQFSNTEKPALDNLGDSLPEPLDFASAPPSLCLVRREAVGIRLEAVGGTEIQN